VAADALRNAFCTGAYCSMAIFAVIGVYGFISGRLRALLARVR
jgi:F420-0:gamma-glutamyl ligase-like protein